MNRFFDTAYLKNEKDDLAVTLCEYIKDVDGNKCLGIESDPIHCTKGDVNICTIVYTETKTKVTYYITVEGGAVYGVYEGYNWPADERYVGVQVKPNEKIKVTVEASEGWFHMLPQNIKGEESTNSIMMQSGESWEFVPRTEITEDDKRNYYCALALFGHKGDPNGEHTNWCLPFLRFNGVEEYTKAPLSYYEVKVHING